ncbi:MAG: C39 family peptidase [Acidihalobacter sp.]
MSDSSVDRPSPPEVPYFSQWESAALAPALIAGVAGLADDPHWAVSGARSLAEYVAWADHVCGMACLKMVLAARIGRVVPTLELARGARHYGAYTVDGGAIKGLIYAPFTTFLAREFSLRAQVVTGIGARELPRTLERAEFFMASVHPSIRRPQMPPPAKGGHLVLVTAADHNGVIFHNPSGHGAASRVGVHLSLTTFEKFFAGRGVAILPSAWAGASHADGVPSKVL